MILSSPAEAHAGGGPPFVKVNGSYAQTNPYYQGNTTLNIPQDLAPDQYLPNTPINLNIDTDALSKQSVVPPQFAKELTLRWLWSQGDRFEQTDSSVKTGESASLSFGSAKSYLITLEAKLPMVSNYTVIDTIRIDVVPNVFYHRPQLDIFLGTADLDPYKQVYLVDQATFDPSVKSARYFWDFNDGKVSSGKTQIREFNPTNSLGRGAIYSRVIDNYGLVADLGFTEEIKKEKLFFAGFSNASSTPIILGDYNKAIALSKDTSLVYQQNMTLLLITISLLIAMVGAVIVVYVRRRMRKYT